MVLLNQSVNENAAIDELPLGLHAPGSARKTNRSGSSECMVFSDERRDSRDRYYGFPEGRSAAESYSESDWTFAAAESKQTRGEKRPAS